MATRMRIPGTNWAALVAFAGAILLAGCDSGPIRNLAGGTSSKEKQPIPPAVNAQASPAAAPGTATSPQVEGPVASEKGTPSPTAASDDPEKPLREQAQEYRAGRQRDPFVSLVGGDTTRSELVDLGIVRLVGVVTGSGDRPFCVVEDPEGVTYVLYVGDRVRNGRVVSIKSDALVCSQTVLGYTSTVQLKLQERKDVKHG